MAKRKSLRTDFCPVARSLDAVGDRWSLLIVRDAFDGVRRFSDFQRSLGMARNILSDRLRRLVEEGVLVIQPSLTGMAHQEYGLTMKGKSLFPVVVALRQWGECYLFSPGEQHSQLVHKETGKPLKVMEPCTEDGLPLVAEATVVKKVLAGE